eukprot:PITA_08216
MNGSEDEENIGRERKPVVPFRPVMIYRLFQQWDLDVIGEITSNSSQHHKYILTEIDYFTIWTEAIPLQKVNKDEIGSHIASQRCPTLFTALPSLKREPFNLTSKRINQLVRLEELRDNARNKFKNHQMILKRCFDRHLVGDKDYQVSDLVLKWDKLSEPKGKHTKFQHLWLDSFEVEEKIGQGTYRLKTLQGETKKLPVNGQHLKR